MQAPEPKDCPLTGGRCDTGCALWRGDMCSILAIAGGPVRPCAAKAPEGVEYVDTGACGRYRELGEARPL
jgi:hypothetical protein